jgi:hypothetical protein
MTDLSPEDGTLAVGPESLKGKPDTDSIGQTWQEGDNKFQRAISAWRSRFPIVLVEVITTNRIFARH